MKNIKDEIISDLIKLDAFKYINMDYSKFDRDIVEEQVVEELQYHCKGHQYSDRLKNQLIDLHVNGFVEICEFKHPYEPHDIYLAIDDVIEKRAIPKPFSRKTSLLYGKNLFHTHHSQSFYSIYNCRRYFERNYMSDDGVWRRLEELKSESPTRANLFPVLVNKVFLESMDNPKKTGEWLVFSKTGEKLKFLCLYVHKAPGQNDEGLHSLIKEEI